MWLQVRHGQRWSSVFPGESSKKGWEWALEGQSVYFTRRNPELDAVLIRDFE